MKRKPFNSPFLMMLILAIISVMEDLQTLKYMRMSDAPVNVNLWYFKISVLYFLEAFVYWRLRYKIRESGNAWTHVFLLLIGVFALAYLNMYFTGQVVDDLYSRRSSAWPELMQRILLWVRVGCFVLAHVFFGIAVVKAVKKNAPVPQDGQHHLLDEIIDDPSSKLR